MPYLRLTPTRTETEEIQVAIALAARGRATRFAAALLFALPSPQDEEDLRWYLEDLPRWPRGMAVQIGKRVERRIKEIGDSLFEQIFDAGAETRDLWKQLRGKLGRTTIDVVIQSATVDAVPWELLREPATGLQLALASRSFLRTPIRLPHAKRSFGIQGKVRMLLVISRPAGGADVGYRSVAAGILDALGRGGTYPIEVQVLRPPTFAALAQALRQARAEGRPFHILHFDGHGVWEDLLARYGRRSGRSVRGYLVFEEPAAAQNRSFVDGKRLGDLLAEAEVPLVVLNACRSARAGRSAGPRRMGDVREQLSSSGVWRSLAGELVDAGVVSVVAMAHDTYVDTASRFMMDLYRSLGCDGSLPEAVARARRALWASSAPVEGLGPLQDWTVPVLYVSSVARVAIVPSPSPGVEPEREPPALPADGAYGRDDAVLALERAFDRHRVALLHGQAGGGKTMVARDFARWLLRTGGVSWPILWTSFSNQPTLAVLLDRISETLADIPGAPEVSRGAESDEERLQAVLDLLDDRPFLWVWDDVQSIAPSGADGAPSGASGMRRDLAALLLVARGSKARFLLVSRHSESSWLDQDLACRVALPPLTLEDCWQVARRQAIADGAIPPAAAAWRPLLDFSQGNPLTLRVLIQQALTQGVSTRTEAVAWIARLRAGISAFEDAPGESGLASLRISMHHAIESGFTSREQRTLSLLHLFREAIDVDLLWWMGDDEQEWSLPFLEDLTREAGIQLLDRAAGAGLLTSVDDGEYRIHPVLSWSLRDLFERWHSGSRRCVVTAYVCALGELGTTWRRVYSDGGYNAIRSLRLHEGNLLHAHQLAREMNLQEEILGTLEGLATLYEHAGRRVEWQRLVEDLVVDYVDPGTDGPRPGCEHTWGELNAFRVLFAEEAQDWEKARRLQDLGIAQARRDAETALAKPAATWDDKQRSRVHNLAVAAQELGEILRQCDRPECIDAYREAYHLLVAGSEAAPAAACALAIGNAYRDVTAIFDLDAAAHWYKEGLDICPAHDRLGRARGLGSLAYISAYRLKTLEAEARSDAERSRLFRTAEEGYERALAILPRDAIDDLRVTYSHLGSLYGTAGDIDRSIRCYGESLRLAEQTGSHYWAGITRYNLAVDLIATGRWQDSLEFARAALRDFERYGEAAAPAARDARALIDQISTAAAPSS